MSDGRELRQRKKVNYNLKDAEEKVFAAVIQEQKTNARGRKQDTPSENDDGDEENDEDAEMEEQDNESEDEGQSEGDSEVVSLGSDDEEFSGKKKRKRVAPEDRRELPRRGAKEGLNLKELSDPEESSVEESSEDEKVDIQNNARKRLNQGRPRMTARQAAMAVKAEKTEQKSTVPPKAKGKTAKSSKRRGSSKQSNDSDESEEDQPVQRRARRGSCPREREVDYESVCTVLDARSSPEGVDEFYVAFGHKSYRECEWVPARPLRNDPSKRGLVSQFHNRPKDPLAVHGVLPEWIQVDRVISHRINRGKDEYLVKFRDLSYLDATWETAESLKDDQEYVDAYKAREKATHDKSKFPKEGQTPPETVPEFKNNRTLRDYQVESFKWMVNNMVMRKNCILGDEMGLGKTAQSIAVMEYQRQILGTRGPFLVVAPLTTLGHWKREIETWTDMNVILYNGNVDEREDLRKYEFHFQKARKSNQVKFDVLLTSYDCLLRDKATFLKFHKDRSYPVFQIVIVDEAHRLKTVKSITRQIVQSMSYKWLLLLTGTPVQNNLRELYGIMNLLDPKSWPSEDDFMERYAGTEGAISTVEQIRQLQADLRPILLRRMKEDVEKLPEKEEVIVWVELTAAQKVYYKALYSKQIGALLAGATGKNLPQMRNLAMELRKVCCHPYLCDGLEDNIIERQIGWGQRVTAETELESMISNAGKMVLLAKLLPKLRAEGRKVLIFSQFKIMLNVIEDTLTLLKFPCERIDGDTEAKHRQQAIDRFMAGGDDTFVFLLSTKAGGQGITLTAADTAIIYDSDWNPQNDLQAMARCHRIGQAKEVTIYRLICKDTYEEQLFNVASRKYGLDEAILGQMNEKDPEQSSARITSLLQNGAHALVMDAGSAKASEDFANADINDILAQRTEKRQIGSRAGNTFSTAQFAADLSPAGKKGSARDYWASLMPDDVQEYERKKALGPTPLGPRKRKHVNYAQSPANQKAVLDRLKAEGKVSSEDLNDGEYSGSSDSSSDDEGQGLVEEGKRGRKSVGGRQDKWSKAEVQRLLAVITAFADGHFTDIRDQANLNRPLEEVEEVKTALLLVLKAAVAQAAKYKACEKELKESQRMFDLALQRGGELFEMQQEAIARDSIRTRLAAFKPAQFLAPLMDKIPSSISEVIVSLGHYFQNQATRLESCRLEAEMASNMLKGLQNDTAIDDMRLMRFRHERPHVKITECWHISFDLALLVNVYKYGNKRSSAHMEHLFRDPDSPFYHAVSTGYMTDKEDITVHPDSLTTPLPSAWTSWYPRTAAPIVPADLDSSKYKKLLDQLNQRTKTIIASLADWWQEDQVRREEELSERARKQALNPEEKITGGRERRRAKEAAEEKERKMLKALAEEERLQRQERLEQERKERHEKMIKDMRESERQAKQQLVERQEEVARQQKMARAAELAKQTKHDLPQEAQPRKDGNGCAKGIDREDPECKMASGTIEITSRDQQSDSDVDSDSSQEVMSPKSQPPTSPAHRKAASTAQSPLRQSKLINQSGRAAITSSPGNRAPTGETGRQALCELTGNQKRPGTNAQNGLSQRPGLKSAAKPPRAPVLVKKAQENISPPKTAAKAKQTAPLIDLCSPSVSASISEDGERSKRRSVECTSSGAKKKQKKSMKQSQLAFGSSAKA